MRRVTVLSAIAASLLGVAVYINPAIGIPPTPPGGAPGTPSPAPPPGGTPVSATGTVGEVVTLAANLSNSHLLQGSNGELYLELTVTGEDREAIAAPGRLPMNLAIVIDRSGSMGGNNKLGYARQAAEFLVDQLLPSDRVSLVAYDHNVNVLLESHLVGDGSELRATIRSLQPGGNTNLHGGMVAGAEQVKRHLAGQQINRVILLSDGLANVGISDTAALSQIAQGWSNQGVAVTAMGVGADFNEDLMLSLAEYSGGNYYFIDEPAKLAGIFEHELTQLVATVAQNASITVTLADGVQCLDVPGYTYQQAGQTLTVPLGDMPAGRVRRILVSLRVPTDAPGPCRVAQSRLSYLDGKDGAKRDFDTETLSVNRTENRAAVHANRNLTVLEQNERVGAAQVVEKAVALFEAGKQEAAQALLRSESDALRSRNDTDYNSPALATQADEMEEIAAGIAAAPAPTSEAGKVARKRAKQQAYEYQK